MDTLKRSWLPQIRRAKKIDLTAFHYFRWTLMGVDSKDKIHNVNERGRPRL